MMEWIRAANEENELVQLVAVEIKITQSHTTVWGEGKPKTTAI